MGENILVIHVVGPAAIISLDGDAMTDKCQ